MTLHFSSDESVSLTCWRKWILTAPFATAMLPLFFFEWRWKIWHYTTTSVSFLSSSSFTKKEHIERWQSPFPTVYVLAMLQQYLQAFSWLKFCSCSWEQESILMPDTSSQTTISGTRMQQHARSIKISSISLPRRFYFWYYFRLTHHILVELWSPFENEEVFEENYTTKSNLLMCTWHCKVLLNSNCSNWSFLLLQFVSTFAMKRDFAFFVILQSFAAFCIKGCLVEIRAYRELLHLSLLKRSHTDKPTGKNFWWTHKTLNKRLWEDLYSCKVLLGVWFHTASQKDKMTSKHTNKLTRCALPMRMLALSVIVRWWHWLMWVDEHDNGQ